MDEFTLLEDKPFKFEIILNSNTESADKNYLKLQVIVDFPQNYPNQVPQMRLRNLCPEIINNNKMLELETIVQTKAEENLGNFMIFEICESIRE